MNYIYENAKKVLLEQKDIKGVARVCTHHEYKPYFCICTYKHFVQNPKKKDQRQDYNEYYRKVKDKSEMDILSACFDNWYDACLNDEGKKIYRSQVEDLEIIIAKFEIAVCKTISLGTSPLDSKYTCSKDDIVEYMKIRDAMINKVKELENQTVEYRRMMWD